MIFHLGDGLGDKANIRRLIAFAAMGHGGEIGRIGFDEYALQRNFPDDFTQGIGILESDDAGEGKIETQIQVSTRSLRNSP